MAKRVSRIEQWARQKVRWGFVGLLALMPFFALSYVWLGSTFGHIDWFKIWPELVIAGLGLSAGWLFWRDEVLRRSLAGRKLNWLALIYIVLHVGMAIWKHPEIPAMIAGLMINLRLMAMLLLGQVVAFYWSDKSTVRWVTWAVVAPAFITAVFGLLQVTVLPADFLKSFGYSADTIRPYIRLHANSSVLRFSSTLRGPNPFGAYLVLVVSLFTAKHEASKQKLVWRLGLVAAAFSLTATFSRSAWIGAAIAILLSLYMHAKPAARRRGALAVGVAALLLVVVGAFWRSNNVVENGLFHTDETNIAATSDSGHWAAFRDATKDIVAHPLGSGPGSAGPASLRLKSHPSRVAEDYYLQIAQEVGVFGLVLFLLIFGLVMKQLLERRGFVWPSALLVSGVGLAVANLLLHVWADDTLGIIWWGLAGYFAYLPPKALKN